MRSKHLLFIAMTFVVQLPLAADELRVTFNDGSPSFTFTTVTEANMGEETLSPIIMQAYSTTSAWPFPSVKVEFEPSIQEGTQAYMKNIGTSYPPSAPWSSEDVRLPYTIFYKACYYPNPGTGYPAPSTVQVTPGVGNGITYEWVYASDYACINKDPNYPGEGAELSVRRDTISELPLSGGYSGTITIRALAP